MSPLLAKRLSDESLGSRLASGEAAAFDELYRRYVHRLAAYGAQLLGDGAAGDDVAQSTLLKAYGALRDGSVPDRMRPWLYRIAHNVAIDLAVRRRDVPSAELPEQGTPDAEPFAGELVAALAALPERQRRVYVLRELHGLRIDETAAELSLTAAQVEQSLFAARNRLAEHLVFGDRLNCVAVQRLAAGPLDRDERRALKTHLRSCAGCRTDLGVRGRALSVLPVIPFEWLRGLIAGAAGGGAPVAAKVGVAVATVTLGAGVPVAVETMRVHPSPQAPTPQHIHVRATLQAVEQAAEQATPRRFIAGTAAPAAVSRPTVSSHETHGARSGHEDGTGARFLVGRAVETDGKTEGGGDGSADSAGSTGAADSAGSTGAVVDSHEGHGSGDAPATISTSDRSGSGSAETGDGKAPPALAPAQVSRDGSGQDDSTTTTTTTTSDGSGSGHDGGGGGGGDGGSGGGDGGSGGGDQPPPTNVAASTD